MMIEVIKSKLHCVTVTEANLKYMGSITIDEDLLDAAHLIAGEKVQIVNNNNLFATFQQKTNNVCADVAGASRNKNAHGIQCTAIKSVVSAAPSRPARPLASRAQGHS